jgi:hypothetical protein
VSTWDQKMVGVGWGVRPVIDCARAVAVSAKARNAIESAVFKPKLGCFVSASPKGRGLALRFLINSAAVRAASLWHQQHIVQKNFVSGRSCVFTEGSECAGVRPSAATNGHPTQVT